MHVCARYMMNFGNGARYMISVVYEAPRFVCTEVVVIIISSTWKSLFVLFSYQIMIGQAPPSAAPTAHPCGQSYRPTNVPTMLPTTSVPTDLPTTIIPIVLPTTKTTSFNHPYGYQHTLRLRKLSQHLRLRQLSQHHFNTSWLVSDATINCYFRHVRIH